MGKAPYFNQQQGLFGKQAGKAEAQRKRKHVLHLARVVAEQVATTRASSQLTIDAVMFYLDKWHGYGPSDLGQAAGSVFRGDQWEKVGRKASERASSHGREVTIWKLKYPKWTADNKAKR